jgi:hypothetical protein
VESCCFTTDTFLGHSTHSLPSEINPKNPKDNFLTIYSKTLQDIIMWSKSLSGYTPIRPSTEGSSTSEDGEGKPSTYSADTTLHLSRRTLILATVLNIAVLCVSIFLLSLSTCYYYQFWTLNPHLRQTSSWSKFFSNP